MKSDEEVLKECINIAVKNGWKGMEINYDLQDWCDGSGTHLWLESSSNNIYLESSYGDYVSITEELFSHNFCKALFGELGIEEEKSFSLDEHFYSTGKSNFIEYWEWEMCNLALETDRIEYLRKWLKE